MTRARCSIDQASTRPLVTSPLEETSSLEEAIAHAEKLLFALAIELRRVPIQPAALEEPRGTRWLHVRALELKRDVALWRPSPPSKAERERVFAELEELTREAQSWRAAHPGQPLSPRRFVPSLAAVARLAR